MIGRDGGLCPGEPIGGCEDGWAREAEGEGACGQPSTRAWCDEGQILQVRLVATNNPMDNDSGPKQCPLFQETSGCNCLPYEQCPTFLKV